MSLAYAAPRHSDRYAVPPEQSNLMNSLAQSFFPEEFSKCDQLLRHKNHLVRCAPLLRRARAIWLRRTPAVRHDPVPTLSMRPCRERVLHAHLCVRARRGVCVCVCVRERVCVRARARLGTGCGRREDRRGRAPRGPTSPSVFACGPRAQISPKVLHANAISCCRVIQEPGQFVITFPGTYHAGFNTGVLRAMPSPPPRRIY